MKIGGEGKIVGDGWEELKETILDIKPVWCGKILRGFLSTECIIVRL